MTTHSAQWGIHPGGCGKPPLDEYNRPLYGDKFGVFQKPTLPSHTLFIPPAVSALLLPSVVPPHNPRGAIPAPLPPSASPPAPFLSPSHPRCAFPAFLAPLLSLPLCVRCCPPHHSNTTPLLPEPTLSFDASYQLFRHVERGGTIIPHSQLCAPSGAARLWHRRRPLSPSPSGADTTRSLW
jgi:hypothetical protein